MQQSDTYTWTARLYLFGGLQVLRVVGEQLQCEVVLFVQTRHEFCVGVGLHR